VAHRGGRVHRSRGGGGRFRAAVAALARQGEPTHLPVPVPGVTRVPIGLAYNRVMSRKVPMSGTPDPVVEAYKPGIDRTLIRENLKRSPEERIRRLQQLQAFAEELRRAGNARRQPSDS